MDGHKLYRCLIIIEFKWFSNLYQNRVQGEVPFYRHFTLPRDTWPLVAFDVQTYLQSCIQTYTRKQTKRNNRITCNFYSPSSHDSFVDKIFRSRMLQKDLYDDSSFASFVKKLFYFFNSFKVVTKIIGFVWIIAQTILTKI